MTPEEWQRMSHQERVTWLLDEVEAERASVSGAAYRAKLTAEEIETLLYQRQVMRTRRTS